MAGEDSERNQEATSHKLSEARKRGQVAKSTDMNAALVMAVLLAYVSWRGWSDVQEQFRFDQALFNLVGKVDAGPAVLWQLLSASIMHGLSLLVPLSMSIMIAGIVSNLVQIGPIWSTHPLVMDWKRINPAAGLKRLFSVRTLFDAARACLKLVLLCWVAYGVLMSLAAQFHGMGRRSATGYLRLLLEDIVSMGWSFILMMAVIALLDRLYVRREFAKKLRMSHRDIRDEHKNREGDPRIRARLRELRAETLKRSMAASKTRHADVLVTNPTHLAIALRYEHGKMESPQMLAKGAGAVAEAMRRVAATHNIPVVRNRSLARKLFRELDFDDFVPPALYAEVARIIVWVFAMRQANEALKGER